ncbi:putative 5,10-methenyltetrahydrofolate synthetase [Danaus plexippus plexippus]|uniref:5-formyltetrahydrofolate cyclo-ligase n=1 Tax=Danaus plexippus plexippus TaxID=278856 RepID=A0A212FFP3_DANPL|nr:putative 5,10-methenyltetrahydrofolate synthetase [Danaus plexippus plexippus]
MLLRNIRDCYSKVFRMSRVPNPAKAAIREEIEKRLATLTNEEKKRQSDIVFNKLIKHPFYKSANRISVFMSTPTEVDTAPIIEHVKGKGGEVFVPQYAGGVMKMLKLETGDERDMPATRHGIRQHAKHAPREDALEKGLDLIIAPGVAFSQDGGRVGHGGGYYDKYISNLRSHPGTAPKVRSNDYCCSNQ